MTQTLLLTLVSEGLLAAAWAHWQRKPLVSILLTVSLGNLLTQAMLWLAMMLLRGPYLLILALAEILIWLTEAALLRLVPSNQLTWQSALLLSLGLNAASLGLGWFLPV